MRCLGAGDLVQSMLARNSRGPESEPKQPCKNASIMVHTNNPCDWGTGTGKFWGILVTHPSLSMTSGSVRHPASENLIN